MTNQIGGPVLHIGFPKAASSFLQEIIFPRVPGYLYLNNPDIHVVMGTKYYQRIPEDFVLFQKGNSKYIYSNEGILNYCEHWSDQSLNNYEREIAISNLTRIFRDYGIILIIIRRQDQIIESLFRHKAWKFSGYSNRIFIDYPIQIKHNIAHLQSRKGIYSTDAFDYYKWVMRIANQLGKQRVKILIYEDLVYQPERFFAQLADVFQDNSVADLIRLKEKRINVSPGSSMLLPRLPKSIRWVKTWVKPLLTWTKKVFV